MVSGDNGNSITRRVFLVGTASVGVLTAVSETALAQEDDGEDEDEGEENGTGGDDGEEEPEDDGEADPNADAEVDTEDNGEELTIAVLDNEYEPDDVTIEPGTTVLWVWEGEGQHNVNPTDQPGDADWEGHPDLKADGDYEFTFEVEGEYHYVCDPHVAVGMVGDITVTEDADAAGEAAEVDIHDLGVPILKHYVGIATFFAIFVSLVFNFYVLKYGVSSNSQSPGKR